MIPYEKAVAENQAGFAAYRDDGPRCLHRACPAVFHQSREIVSNVENTLEASVFGAFEDMEYEDGRWDIDSDLMNLEDGVYLSVYDKNS